MKKMSRDDLWLLLVQASLCNCPPRPKNYLKQVESGTKSIMENLSLNILSLQKCFLLKEVFCAL